jgi:hypothetical protein
MNREVQVIGHVRAGIASRRTISVKDSICWKYKSKMLKAWNRGLYLKGCTISARFPFIFCYYLDRGR